MTRVARMSLRLANARVERDEHTRVMSIAWTWRLRHGDVLDGEPFHLHVRTTASGAFLEVQHDGRLGHIIGWPVQDARLPELVRERTDEELARARLRLDLGRLP